ncbi:MAG: type II and III secretion system protein family protein [Alphaproteobacteria bacterium]|nr:MAG: type II and III secretion system protein family protein [Alphaproteobacteria bacterium]
MMKKTFRTGWALTALLLAFSMFAALTLPLATVALAEPGQRSILRIPAGAGHVTRKVTLGLNKSIVVELPREVRDVLVSDPKKMDAVLNSARRAFLIGMEVGQANAFFFDQSGNQILTLEVRVERDLAGVSEILHRLIPGSQIKLEAVNDNIILTGSVANPADATRAADIVSRMVKEKENILNMINVAAKEQILLKVTVAEMERNIIKQLGIDLDALVSSGNFSFQALSDLPFPFSPKGTVIPFLPNSTPQAQGVASTAAGAVGWQSNTGRVNSILRALEQDGLLRTLAEPNLTTISGETANFLAGGEFPIPVAQDNDTITVEFKPFGVALAFTPVVLSESRISLKVSTEVSELTNEGAINVGVLAIPGLKVRRANTTIELPSGGSIVIAGLISEDTKQAMSGYPGLKNLPVLGNLFRSRDFIKSETELIIIVTPYTVNPVARKELARPDKGFAWASDRASNLLGQINRIYGNRPQQMPVGRYQGDYGFIVE